MVTHVEGPGLPFVTMPIVGLKTFRRFFPFALVLLPALLAVLSLAPSAGDSGADAAPVVRLADLPAEAVATLDRIRHGGPFPYARDGAVFFNREKLLPEAPRGTYHEYTVPTPGLTNRGARRIVASDAGDFYYTDDHYRSFRRIQP